MGICGAVGDADETIVSIRQTIDDCPLGALIGKFGGSTASTSVKSSTGGTGWLEATPFVIGSCCIVKIPSDSIGPLFIGFNGLLRSVTIEEDVTIAAKWLNFVKPP